MIHEDYLTKDARELGEQAYEAGHNRAYSQVKVAAGKGLAAPKIDRTFPPEFRGRRCAEQRYLEGCESGELKALDKYFPETAAKIRALAADLEAFAELPEVVREEEEAVASFRQELNADLDARLADMDEPSAIPTPTNGKLVWPEESSQETGRPVTVPFVILCAGLSFFITILWLFWR